MNNLEQDKDRLQHLQSFSRCQSDVAPWMLNAQRLEEGWFILKLCQFHQSMGDYSRNFHTELVNGRKDIEQLCKAAYEVFSTEVPQWIQHKCSVTGCSTGYATLVDRFHVSKHTEKCCIPVANNPLCKYNPDLPEFKEVSGVNTECAEQAFRWLNGLKYSVRQIRYNFFLHELINVHNRLCELKLKSIGKL